jgi:hypothetical protein
MKLPAYASNNDINLVIAEDSYTLSQDITSINAWSAFNANTASDADYLESLNQIKPHMIRLHAAESLTVGHSKALIDNNGDWNEAKIVNIVNNLSPYTDEIMFNIAKWPDHIDGSNTLDPAKYTDFVDWCKDLATIISNNNLSKITYIEVLNETEGGYNGNTAEMANIVNLAAAGIKQILPGIKIVAGAWTQPYDNTGINNFMAALDNNLIDAFSYHHYVTGDSNLTLYGIYSRSDDFAQISSTMRGYLANNGLTNKKLYLNETNVYYSWNQDTRDHMKGIVGAISLARTCYFALKRKLSADTITLDGVFPWNDADNTYGVLDPNNSYRLRPAGAFMAEFSKHFSAGEIHDVATNTVDLVAMLNKKDAQHATMMLINDNTKAYTLKDLNIADNFYIKSITSIDENDYKTIIRNLNPEQRINSHTMLFVEYEDVSLKQDTNTIHIRDCEQLKNLTNDQLSYELHLDTSIDCAGAFSPIGDINHPFTGTFYGHHNTIKNLNLNSASDHQAMFPYSENATFKNISFTNCSVTGQDNIALLVAHADNVLFEKIKVYNSSLNVRDKSAFLVSEVSGSAASIKNCSFKDLNVSGRDEVAIVGYKASDNVYIKDVNLTDVSLTARENSAALFAELANNINVSNVIADRIKITGLASSVDLAGLVSHMDFSFLNHFRLNNISINATNTSAERIAGVAAHIINNSKINDVIAENIQINSLEKVAALVGEAYFQSNIENCYLKDVILNVKEESGGLVANIDKSYVTNCHIDGLELKSTHNSIGGMFNDILNRSIIDKCSLINAHLDLAGIGNGAFVSTLTTNSDITSSYVNDTKITGTSTGFLGGFVNILSWDAKILSSYVNNVSMDLPNGSIVAGFVRYMDNFPNISNCYVVNTKINAQDQVAGFLHRSNNSVNSTISNSYAAVEMLNNPTNADHFALQPTNMTLTGDLSYNSDLNNGLVASNNASADALNAAAFTDINNFSNLNTNIWQTNNLGLHLKNTPFKLLSDNNKIQLGFTSVPRKPTITKLISGIRVVSNSETKDFKLSIKPSLNSHLFEVKNNKLYANYDFIRDKTNLNITLVATNSLNQYIEQEFKINIIDSDKINNRNNEEGNVDGRPIGEPDEETPVIEDCLENLYNYLGKSVDSDVSSLSGQDLAKVYLKYLDSGDESFKNILECDGIKARADDEIKLIDILPFNKRNRLNFKTYRRFLKDFRKELRNQHEIACADLNYDTNEDCLLNEQDLDRFKAYFELSIGSRKNNNKFVDRLNKLEKNFKLTNI